MTQTTARIKKGNSHFEILVDMDAALKFRKTGVGNALDFLETETIFDDAKKGNVSSKGQLENAFGTSDPYQIAENIVKHGEILVNEEHRSAEHEMKIKQVVEFLSKNAVDPRTGNPHTPDRIKSALDQAHVISKNVPIDQQIPEIIDKISSILAIKVATKKVKVIIPAIHTGRAYGVINPYRESENWKDDGSLEVVVSVPAGMIMDFYDKLNGVTHGAAITEEVRE